jgi:hypothetical protein
MDMPVEVGPKCIAWARAIEPELERLGLDGAEKVAQAPVQLEILARVPEPVQLFITESQSDASFGVGCVFTNFSVIRAFRSFGAGLFSAQEIVESAGRKEWMEVCAARIIADVPFPAVLRDVLVLVLVSVPFRFYAEDSRFALPQIRLLVFASLSALAFRQAQLGQNAPAWANSGARGLLGEEASWPQRFESPWSRAFRGVAPLWIERRCAA